MIGVIALDFYWQWRQDSGTVQTEVVSGVELPEVKQLAKLAELHTFKWK